jgi:hypothetical protein
LKPKNILANNRYNEFKIKYKVPKIYLEYLKTDNLVSREMKKMMTPTEIEDYFEKWLQKFIN